LQAFFNLVVEFFRSQTFVTGDLAVVLLLTILEGLLSIDNALVLGLLAKRLPKHLQPNALTYGLIAAVVFRFMAIFMASLLLRWTIVKLFGGAYLVYIAVRHLFFEAKEEEPEKIVLDEGGNPVIVDEETGGPLRPDQEELEIRERVPVYIKPKAQRRAGVANFWPTVISIALTDIAFAVDSILAAIALVGSAPDHSSFHPKLWVVFTGGGLGVLLLRFAAAMFIKLLEKFPRFEVSAYLLVMVIGCKLLGDWGLNSDWSSQNQPQWLAQRLGGWKQAFDGFEDRRNRWIDGYEQWLHDNWIFKIQPHDSEPPHNGANADRPGAGGEPPAPHEAAATGVPEAPEHLPADGIPHARHLLDFHDLRRPECITFWFLMLTCFLTGFIPPRKKHEAAAA
jgi:YkoY family integral membrane protein